MFRNDQQESGRPRIERKQEQVQGSQGRNSLALVLSLGFYVDGISPVSCFSSPKKESVFSSKYLVSYYSSRSLAFILKNPIAFRNVLFKCCKTSASWAMGSTWLPGHSWVNSTEQQSGDFRASVVLSAGFRCFWEERSNLHPAFLPNLAIHLPVPVLGNLAFLFYNEVRSVLIGIGSDVGFRCRNTKHVFACIMWASWY